MKARGSIRILKWRLRNNFSCQNMSLSESRIWVVFQGSGGFLWKWYSSHFLTSFYKITNLFFHHALRKNLGFGLTFCFFCGVSYVGVVL